MNKSARTINEIVFMTVTVMFGCIYFLGSELPKSLGATKEINRIENPNAVVLDDSQMGDTDVATCKTDSDCTVGIQPASCCGCPRAINKNIVGSTGWEKYIMGKNYGMNKEITCQTFAACKTCQSPAGPVTCQKGKCVLPLTAPAN